MRKELEDGSMLEQYIDLKNKVDKAFKLRKLELFFSLILCFIAMGLSYKLKVVIHERDNAIEVTKQYYQRYMKISSHCEKK